MSEWIGPTFDQKNSLYERIFLPSMIDTEKEIDYLINFAQITQKDRIIDIACGTGRHVLAFNRRGFSADGVDISDNSIKKAKTEANSLSGSLHKPKFYVADVRNLPTGKPRIKRKYDIATCMFSSFGYYEDDSQQTIFLEGIRHVLKFHSLLLLDLPNKDYILSNFAEESAYEKDKLEVKVRRKFDSLLSRVETITEISEEDDREVINIAMNIYTYREITDLLLRSGFSVEKIVSGFDGKSFDVQDSNNKRMIILARKI